MSKDLGNQLRENSRNRREKYDKLTDELYNCIQEIIIETLNNFSQKNNACYYTVKLHNLYIKDYKDTLSGLCDNSQIESLTSKLEEYLTSQNLTVSYISHCNMKISWE
jgi:hypothetical protein